MFGETGTRDRSTGGAGLALGWLAHPVTLLAIVLLVVNDHLLKAAYPGPVTGKLSDVAGLVVLPPLLALALAGVAPRLSGRRVALAGLGLTGVAFALVKATPAGAAAASALWTGLTGPSVILADRTDLVALPALGVAGWVWTRGRRRALPAGAVRRFGVLVVLPTAVLGLAATSAPSYPDSVAVTTWRNQVAVGQADAYHGSDGRPERWWVGERDGRDWRPMTPEEELASGAELAGPWAGRPEACVPDQPARCYRVVPGRLRVEETADGGATWRSSWEVPDERRRYLVRRYDGLHDPDADLASRALVVRPTGAGHVVVVANGRDGIAVRDPAGGWSRIGFTPYGGAGRPMPVEGPALGALVPEVLGALLVGLLVIGVGGCLAARRGGGTVVPFAIPLVLAAALAPLGVAGWYAEHPRVLLGWFSMGLGLLLALAGAGGVVLVAAIRRMVAERWLPLLVLIGALTGAAWFAAFVGWAAGLTGYRSAALLGVLAGLVGALAAGRLGHAIGRVPPPRPTAPHPRHPLVPAPAPPGAPGRRPGYPPPGPGGVPRGGPGGVPAADAAESAPESADPR
ncbi:hypothetical protein [Plantactinospora sp. CA-290183]|uniref:hypothetical protein n=1 Tax=Plantactinospora sp. CA-290183 TaxID=3240006 RepID=UPI003D8D0988